MYEDEAFYWVYYYNSLGKLVWVPGQYVKEGWCGKPAWFFAGYEVPYYTENLVKIGPKLKRPVPPKRYKFISFLQKMLLNTLSLPK